MRQIILAKHQMSPPARRPKLDARLATLKELGEEAYGASGVSKYERGGGVVREGPLAFSGLGDPRELSDNMDLFVFVTLEEPDQFEHLLAEVPGLRIRSRARTIATAVIQYGSLEALESNPRVRAIEWSGSVRPASTAPAQATTSAGDPAFTARRALGLGSAPADLDGKGVIVGVVDVEGLDLYHPAFVNQWGRTRVLSLWDQRASAPEQACDPPKALLSGAAPKVEYGLCYDRDLLNAELAPGQPMPFDVAPHRALKGSHGTKTAGLAAGLSYREGGGIGVAGGADLVFVNTWGSGAGSLGAMTELADGIAFVFDVAKAEGKPCVVNVSLGDDLGPRDGRSAIERFIEEKIGPGRAVVVAAGNSHGRNRHRGLTLRAGETAALDISVGPDNDTHASVEIWYRGRGAGALDLRLAAPDGRSPTAAIPPDGVARIFETAGTCALVLSAPDVATSPGDSVIRVELLPLDKPDGSPGELTAGIWRLHLSSRGAEHTIDAWIHHRYIRFVGDDPETDANTLTTPSTSHGAISVGACDPSGRPSFYSGRGPGRDPERGTKSRPDLLALGGPLIVASAATTPRAVDASGTSMSAALVTGAIALAYQRFGPSLTRKDLLQALVPSTGAPRDTQDPPPVVNLAHWFDSPREEQRTTGESLPPRGQLPCRGDITQEEQRASTNHPEETTMNQMSHSRPAISVQIMLGVYKIFQEIEVGRLFVEQLNGPTSTREHWILYSSYRWPSAEFPRQQITFEYQGNGEGLDARTFKAAAPSGSTYVIADCRQETVV